MSMPHTVQRLLCEARDRDAYAASVTKEIYAKPLASASTLNPNAPPARKNPWDITTSTKSKPKPVTNVNSASVSKPTDALPPKPPVVPVVPVAPAVAPIKAAVPKPDEKIEKGGYVSRLNEHSFAGLQNHYRAWRGRRIHEPSKTEMLPPIITREAALRRHSAEHRVQFLISQVVDLTDELWLFGRTNTTASVGLQLLDFHPFFFISTPSGASNVGGGPTLQDCHKLLETLNREENWPKGWDRHVREEASERDRRMARHQAKKHKLRKRQQQQQAFRSQNKRITLGVEDEMEDENESEDDDDLMPEEEQDEPSVPTPIVQVQVDHRKNAVIYTGGEKQHCFRIDFRNMQALKHYREQLALRKMKIGWDATLFHEEHSLTQMFFHQTPFRLKDYVEVDPRQCQFYPSKAWEVLGEQIELDDRFREEAVEANEEEDAFRQARILCRRAEVPKTWCHLEGQISYHLVKPASIDAVAPAPICTFDIETSCGDAVDFYRKHKIIPHYDDDIDDEPKKKTASSSEQEKKEEKKFPPGHAEGGLLDRWCTACQIALPLDAPVLAAGKDTSPDDALKYKLTDEDIAHSAHWMTVIAYPQNGSVMVSLHENIYSHQFLTASVRDDDADQHVTIQHITEKEARDLVDIAHASLDAVVNNESKNDSEADDDDDEGGGGPLPPPPTGPLKPKRLEKHKLDALDKKHVPKQKEEEEDQDNSPAAIERARKRVEGRFPIPTKKNDAVILIATELLILGDKESFLSILHCLGKPAFKDTDLPDTVVFTFEEDNECGMLEHWSRMTRVFDVEWLAGYNSLTYDLPFVFQRAKLHGSIDIFRNLARFQTLPHDRLRNSRRYKECMPHERRFGGTRGVNNEMPQIEIPGLIQFDALKIVKLLEKMNTYRLSEVAKELLKGSVQKKDIPHVFISPFFAAGPEYQRKLAIYCYYDVKVTVAVMVVRFLLGHAIEVARASWTSIMQQMMQGAQIKTWNLLCRTAHVDGWLLDEGARQYVQKLHGLEVDPLPRYLRKYLKDDYERMSAKEQGSLRREKKYDGAFVLDPRAGLYDKYFVNTLDFASLYPSIMIAFNLCFSSFIDFRYDPKTGGIWFPYFDDSYEKRSTDKYILWYPEKERPSEKDVGNRVLILVCVDEKTGHTECFVQNTPTLLPGILKGLIAMRKQVKNVMEPAELEVKSLEDEMKKAEAAGEKDKYLSLKAKREHLKLQVSVLDSRQAAIKVLCNASYGFCGATAGFFGLISIAITTCFMGRWAILLTKQIVETKYGGIIVYGDTDSVFILLPKLEAQSNKTREQIFEDVRQTCIDACSYISSLLPKPMKLEYEKSFRTFLMMPKKKSYTGIFCYPPEKVGKFLIKGLAPVRRDTAQIAQTFGMDTLRAALDTPYDDELLLAPLKKALAELVDPNIQLTRLQKTVAKRPAYKGNADRLIQKRLFDKIKERTGVEVDSGTRVAFIVTLPRNGAKRVRGKYDKLFMDGEETSYCQDNNIPADRAYYCEKQIEAPLLRYLFHTNLHSRIRGMVRQALDTIWVQDTRNLTITHFLKPARKK